MQGHASALPRVAALARRYLAERDKALAGAPRPQWLLQLPGESRPTTRSMSGWLASALARCDITAPPGVAYLGHSIRSGAASAQAAIGVDHLLIRWLGGWARGSATMERDYIDPTVLPTPAAYALWGWALSRQYSADAGVVGRFVPLPDPREVLPCAAPPPRRPPTPRAAPRLRQAARRHARVPYSP